MKMDLLEGFDEWSAPEIHRRQQGEKFTPRKHIRATTLRNIKTWSHCCQFGSCRL